MAIRLVESGREFSDGDIDEIKGFLSKLPYSHVDKLYRIERLPIIIGDYANVPHNLGGEMGIADDFYHLNKEEREFIFIHEMGHNFFNSKDENEGKYSSIGLPCKREDIEHLSMIQWMELGNWELDPRIWKTIEKISGKKDKYNHLMEKGKNDHEIGEWKCPTESRILENLFDLAFRYDKYFYSPKEEMADAYALFAADKNLFKKYAEKNENIKAKYNFISKFFEENSKGEIIFKR